MRIRPAAPGELPALQDVERAAGAPFRDLGMPEIADDEPPALDIWNATGGPAAAGSRPTSGTGPPGT
ncbi:hypothetical protein GCM10010266_29680 [Streptomyces griseomycini]|nr:hypothetical protein GCM10010266_29680 [Streptomyces griseomycini]